MKILIAEDQVSNRTVLRLLLEAEKHHVIEAVDGAEALAILQHESVDLIISDIAPNITGIDSADQASSMYFLELARDTVKQTLKPGATFVAKMFQGAGSDQYVKELRASFAKVLIRKPAASRAESREV